VIFIDSSVFIAYANKKDFHHEKAVKIFRNIVDGVYRKAFFSDYIFAETVTVMFLKTEFILAEKFGEYLLSSEIELLKVDEGVFERAWEIFRKTRTMSFTDCSSLALMELLEIRKIATFDKGFSEKAEVIE
jgi:predicted nucleic acid-binding protein